MRRWFCLSGRAVKKYAKCGELSAYADIVRERAVVREMISVRMRLPKLVLIHKGVPVKICSPG